MAENVTMVHQLAREKIGEKWPRAKREAKNKNLFINSLEALFGYGKI